MIAQLAQNDLHDAQAVGSMPTVDIPGYGRVAINEYPNPPWNTIPYEWNREYSETSREWSIQHLVKTALRIGLQYTTDVDKYGRPAKLSTGMSPEPLTQEHAPARPGVKIVNGVLTDTYLLYSHDGKLVKAPVPSIEHVGDIFQLCLEYGVETIWVLAGSHLGELATEDFINNAPLAVWKVSNASYTKGPKGFTPMCKFVRGWKLKDARKEAESGRICSVGFAEHTANDKWGFDEIESAVTLLATISYEEDALGISLLYSPNNVGKRLMEEENQGTRKSWIRPVDLHEIKPVVDTGAVDCTWKRAFTQAELESMVCLIAYDKNAEYPASCTSVLLGEGMPTYHARPGFDVKKLRPGVFHCTISGTSPFDGVTLPHPTNGVTDGWFWTYTVKLLAEVGYTVTIEEAWTWEHAQAHTTLRPWAERLYDARMALKSNTERYTHKEARTYAYDASKEVANQAIGLLDHKPDHPDWAGAFDWFRPDWNALIKDNGRYWMFRRIMKYLALGYIPVGIHADCLYYLASDMNPQTALPEMMERADKLGGFKVKYKHAQAFPIEQVTAWFGDPRMEIGEINQRLNQLDREIAQNERTSHNG